MGYQKGIILVLYRLLGRNRQNTFEKTRIKIAFIITIYIQMSIQFSRSEQWAEKEVGKNTTRFLSKIASQHANCQFSADTLFC